MNLILQTLQDQSFLQSILLLLITAGVTSLLVPRVTARLDQEKFERQKIFEDELARRAKLREEKSKLLDDLESFLWDYQFLALEPSYFVLRGNVESFKSAFQKYDEKAPLLLAQISAKVSKLDRLAHNDTYQIFYNLLHRNLMSIDGELVHLGEKADFTNERWREHHGEVYEGLNIKIKEALQALAAHFGYIGDTAIATPVQQT